MPTLWHRRRISKPTHTSVSPPSPHTSYAMIMVRQRQHRARIIEEAQYGSQDPRTLIDSRPPPTCAMTSRNDQRDYWSNRPMEPATRGPIVRRRCDAESPHRVREYVTARLNLAPKEVPIIWMYRTLAVRFCNVCGKCEGEFADFSLLSHRAFKICGYRRPFLGPLSRVFVFTQSPWVPSNNTRADTLPPGFSLR